VDEVATTCDYCYTSIAYHERCVLRQTGELVDGLPLIKILCAVCAGGIPEDGPVIHAIREEDLR
jgi:hypothetical protein